MNSGAEDKRKEKRFPNDANVEVTFGEKTDVVYAACCNISRSGVLIKAAKPFEPAEKLKLTILEAGKAITAKATVVHCRPFAQGFYIGCSADFSNPEMS